MLSDVPTSLACFKFYSLFNFYYQSVIVVSFAYQLCFRRFKDLIIKLFSVFAFVFRRSYLSSLFQSRGLSHSELSTVFLPSVAKSFPACLPPDAVEIGIFPGSAPLNVKNSGNSGNVDRKVINSELDNGDAVDDENDAHDDDADDLLIEDFD